MSRKTIVPVIFGIFPLLVILSCASADPGVKQADDALDGVEVQVPAPAPDYEEVIASAAADIALKLPPQARVAILDFRAEPEGLSHFVMVELAAALDQAGLETVARSSLEYVRRELDPPIGKGRDQFISQQVGARYSITGQFASAGSRSYRLDFKVTNVESAKNEAAVRLTVANSPGFREFLTALREGSVVSGFGDYGISAESAPGSPGEFLDQGMFFAGRNEPGRGIECFSAAAGLDADYILAYYWRGWLRYGIKDYEQALEDYRRVAAADLNNRAVHSRLGELCFLTGDYDGAVTAYTTVVKLDPRNGGAYNRRGTAYLFKDDLGQAIGDFTRAVKIDPRNPLFYHDRGEAYAFNGDYDRAIADFTQTIRLDPEFAPAYRGRGKAYSDTGDTGKAIDDYTQAISLEPSFAGVYNLRGILYLSPPSPDYPRAIADFAEASRLEPANQLYHRNLQVARERQAGRR